MDSFEFNKIAAAVLVTALLFIGIKEIGNFVYKVDKPKKSAYKIEGVADTTKTTNEKVKIEEKLASIKPLLASASIESGAKVFKKCAACHSIDKGGANKIGPALWGVVNRKIGGVQGFKYSTAMAKYGKNWSFEELNGFLHKPMKYIKGTKMGFIGLKKDKDRANVIAYMNSKSDTPVPVK
jgi:cytochrome c